MTPFKQMKAITFSRFFIQGWSELAHYKDDDFQSDIGPCKTFLIKNGLFRVVEPYQAAFFNVFNPIRDKRTWVSGAMYGDNKDEKFDLPQLFFYHFEEDYGSKDLFKYIKRAILIAPQSASSIDIDL